MSLPASRASNESAAAPLPHLLLPFAACAAEGWRSAVPATPGGLRNLRALLQGMQVLDTDAGDARSLSPPHERALARALGWTKLTDGLLPWAAWQRLTTTDTANTPEAHAQQAWAIVTPCHWAMGREHATLSDPQALQLSPEESQALMAAMQPYFLEDGIHLHYAEAQRWLAAGEPLRGQPTASLDRVLGRDVDRWLPSAASAKTLRRLQNEMQMLMYTHPVNEQRSARGLPPVNSIWFSGTGDLPGTCPPVPAGLEVPRTLANAALAGDWAAYQAAWQLLDAGAISDLLQRQQAGQSVRLTLCGERQALTLQTAQRGWLASLAGRFKSIDPISLLDSL